MWQIFIGSLLLSLIHALIPHHWIPLIAISKSENWTTRESILATIITSFSHMISTIIIGIIVGFVGIKLSESYSNITSMAAPTILLGMGVIFLLLDFLPARHHHNHFDLNNEKVKTRKTKTAIITSLSLAMFLTPCIEIEVFYFQAANFGWPGILMVSAVYLIMTLIFLIALVYLGLKGVNRFNSNFLEHHAKSLTGTILILLGIIAYFVEF